MCSRRDAPIHGPVGLVVDFPSPRRTRYEEAALDRLLAELDRRGGLRAVAGDPVAVPARPLTAANVVPFRLADR